MNVVSLVHFHGSIKILLHISDLTSYIIWSLINDLMIIQSVKWFHLIFKEVCNGNTQPILFLSCDAGICKGIFEFKEN